ncbi:MAG TPA: tetratricopeptide repeat protein [Symbiobacteriaceae bacterium]
MNRLPSLTLTPRADQAPAPHNLHSPFTSFVGRERELAEVRNLLTATRLLTLTGAGGCGKTRLGLQLGLDVLAQYPDGVWLVELGALSDPAQVPRAVAAAMGLAEDPAHPIIDTLTDFLQLRTVLLVLDNCEHLVQACALLADRLLRAGHGLRIVTTSRQALGIVGETVWEVPPLSLPPARRRTVADLQQSEAVRLLCDRIQAVEPSFGLTEQNASAVVEVCRHLDGIPLALELAAARAKALSVQQIAERLDSRFRLLTQGNRSALPHQQTLRATVDWSYHLLADAERQLWSRLSLFAGGFSLEAAEGICSDGGIARDEVLDLLVQLVDKSIVTVDQHGQSRRYRLLETLRAYGAERLQEAGEAEVWRDRFRNWYLELARSAAQGLNGPEVVPWLERLDLEFDNLAAALAYCKSDPINVGTGLRLCGFLGEYWEIRCLFSFSRQQVSELLSLAPDLEFVEGAAEALQVLGLVYRKQGDYALARSTSEQGLAIARSQKQERSIAAGLAGLGYILRAQGEHTEANHLLAESLLLWRKLADPIGIATALLLAGTVSFDSGELDSAAQYWEESYALYQQEHCLRGIGRVRNDLGIVAYERGDAIKAEALWMESLALARLMQDWIRAASALHNLGFLAELQGKLEQAGGYFSEGLRIAYTSGATSDVLLLLDEFAFLAARQGTAERAAVLLGAREASQKTQPRIVDEYAQYDRSMALIREALGESAEAVLAIGKAMSLAEVIEYALSATAAAERELQQTETIPQPIPPAKRNPSPDPGPDLLTDREREVVRLVALGLSDRNIAERLHISRHTVSTHLKHILGKLGLSSRAGAAAWAVRNAL